MTAEFFPSEEPVSDVTLQVVLAHRAERAQLGIDSGSLRRLRDREILLVKHEGRVREPGKTDPGTVALARERLLAKAMMTAVAVEEDQLVPPIAGPARIREQTEIFPKR